jgi:diguanylate cyclase (GGDEF)-like protein
VKVLDRRQDTSLALALIAGVFVIFQQPLRLVIEAARDVELRYHIDLIPGLTVLVATFGFHQYRKREHAKAAAQAAQADAALERARAIELERLMAFGRALGNALEPAAIRQVFWRYLPEFALDRELWMLTMKTSATGGWDLSVRDATAASERSLETLEAIATEALAVPAQTNAPGDGLVINDEVCFPMIVGQTALGVVGVRNAPRLSGPERKALAAAVALLAIAIRNVQLLMQSRETSMRDHLTGCFNRSYALESLNAELKRSIRTGRQVSVLMFDIDQFKAVNDRHGHLAGDALLAAVGVHVSRSLRGTDVKCRYGGDEFLIILPDTSIGGAERAAESLIVEIARLSVPTDVGVISPTISIGVATSDGTNTDPLALVSHADAALYRAKQSGRNRYALAQSSPAEAVR